MGCTTHGRDIVQYGGGKCICTEVCSEKFRKIVAKAGCNRAPSIVCPLMIMVGKTVMNLCEKSIEVEKEN